MDDLAQEIDVIDCQAEQLALPDLLGAGGGRRTDYRLLAVNGITLAEREQMDALDPLHDSLDHM